MFIRSLAPYEHRRAVSFARLASLVLSLATVACRTESNLDRPPAEYVEPDPAKLEIVRRTNREGRMVQESAVLTRKGHAPIPHGADHTWYASGAKEWERAYDHGQPTGTWKRWYENGQQESETTFAGPTNERPMRFWYEDGRLAAEGVARDGSRCGPWRFWRPDGTLREEGRYVDSLREGPWTFVDPDGAKHTAVYERNVLVSR